MNGFTLETKSFGSRLFLKSSPNKIITTHTKALISNGVQLELCHNNEDIYDFVISIRKNKTKEDDGLSYAYALESYKMTPYLNENGYYCSTFDVSEYFDECPKGTWQLQAFLKNKETKLTEHFIYIDLVFSNELQIKHETTTSKELQIKNYFSLPEENNIIINNATGNLYYSYLIYRKVNNKYEQYYRSEQYPIIENTLNINWQERESYKTIEKHILTGLNSESHIYVLITTDSKQSVSLPEFTYLKYTIKRNNNIQIVGGSNNIKLGERNTIPTLKLTLRSKFEPSVIPSYSVKCDWMLLTKDGNIKRTLFNMNFDNKLINTATQDGVKPDIVIPDILSIDSHIDKNFWNTKILPENYLGEYSNDVLIRVTITGFDNSSGTDLYNQPGCIDEITCDYSLTRISGKPTINIKDTELGKITAPPTINYTITDNDTPKIIVKETIDLSGKDEELFLKQFTVNEINSKVDFNASSNITRKLDTTNFAKLSDGKHIYSIYIGDGVNEPTSTRIYFEKLPNKAPIISGEDNINIEEIYVPKEFKYSVVDPEQDVLTVEEYYDNTMIGKPFIYSNEKTVNYDSQFKNSELNSIHKVTVKVKDGVNVSNRTYTFKKIQGPPPIISGLDTNLKKVFKPKPLEYTVSDPSRGSLTITEYFDKERIGKHTASNEYKGKLNYTTTFNKANPGSYNIVILADNGYDQTTRIYTIEKISSSIDKFLITPSDIGDISTELNVSVNVWNVLGNEMTYDIVLNGKTISSNNDFSTIVEHVDNITKYRIDYSLNENSEEFKNLPAQNTIKFVVKDTDDCVQEIIYTFNKINKNPKITIERNDLNLYLLQIKDQKVQCYNTNDAKLIIKLNDKDIEFNGLPYINIPKNTYENQFTYLFSLPSNLWNPLDKYSENKITFILLDTITNEKDKFEYTFIKGHENVLTWKPEVSEEGLLEWSPDGSLDIPEPVNIKGPSGPTGKTPKISIGNVDSIEAGEKPSIKISNDDVDNPILDFKLPKGEGVSRYVSNVPSTVQVGGIETGFTSDGIEVADLIYLMLHPYVKPNIIISSNPVSGLKKLGTTINVQSVRADIQKTSNDIESVKLYKNDVLLNNFELNSNNQYEYNLPINITDNTTFKFEVNDGRSTSSKSISYTFINPMYHGNTLTVPTGMTGLTEMLSTKSNKSITFSTSEMAHQVFAYPLSYGKLNSITDEIGFNCMSGFECITLIENNVEYYVYYTRVPSIVNNYKYNFNF